MSGEASPLAERPSYWLTRFVVLRLLGLVYTVAFLVIVNQWQPLLGSDGLLPAALLPERVAEPRARLHHVPESAHALLARRARDTTFRSPPHRPRPLPRGPLRLRQRPHPGHALAALHVLRPRGPDLLRLRLGDRCSSRRAFSRSSSAPLWRLGPFPRRTPPSPVVIVLLRWLIFRLMLGAGLIKLRGDPCWRDLTCLVFHYETQPNPNPLSWYFHQLPVWFHQIEVLFNHLVELVAPFFVFGPRRARHVAGGFIVALPGPAHPERQSVVPELAHDHARPRLLRRRASRAARAREEADGIAERPATAAGDEGAGHRRLRPRRVVALLSVNPWPTWSRPARSMNTSFDPFDLVNTYGAFGSIGRERYEIVLEGTTDDPENPAAPRGSNTTSGASPGDTSGGRAGSPRTTTGSTGRCGSRPCPAPYRRVVRPPGGEAPSGRPHDRGLLAPGPFQDRPPRSIRAAYYRYQFTRPGEPTHDFWKRTLAGGYLPALTRDDPRLRDYLRAQGWN